RRGPSAVLVRLSSPRNRTRLPSCRNGGFASGRSGFMAGGSPMNSARRSSPSARSDRDRLMPLPPISGGSDADLREIVRRRLRQGTLTAATRRWWPAARATRQNCLVCATPIAEPDTDYAIPGAIPRHAHAACYRTWMEESVALGLVEPLDMRKPVALHAEPDTSGRIMATLDRGQWIYVMWMRRPGYEGKMTKESAADLRPANEPNRAV